MVYHYARTLIREHETAEDVVADTYLKVWRARSNFSGRGSRLSWVMAITRNCAMDHLRARKPNVSLDLFEAIGDPGGPDRNEPWLSEADAEAIRRAVARLSEEQQQVIFLRFYQDLPHDAVAAKLGKSSTAIRQIQFRALMRLRKFLQGATEAEGATGQPASAGGAAPRERRARKAAALCRVRRSSTQKTEDAGA
jgi:RNA polymerase sigma factor (sigma-70 family)